MNQDIRSVEEQKHFDAIARRAERVDCNNCSGGWTRDGDECSSCQGDGTLIWGEPYQNLYDAQEALDALIPLGRKMPRDLYMWTPGIYATGAKNCEVWVGTRRLSDGKKVISLGSWDGTQWLVELGLDPLVICWRIKENAPDFPLDEYPD